MTTLTFTLLVGAGSFGGGLLGALTGLGGCPFAGDELVGNIRTEDILAATKKAGGDTGIDESKLSKVLDMTNEIRTKYAHAPIAS